MKMKLPELLVAIAAVSMPLAGAAPWENIYTSGHADLGVAYEGGQLHLHYHFGSDAVINGSPLGALPDEEDYEYEIDDVTTYVSSGAKVTAPNIPALNNGTGASPGSDLWLLPQVQDPSLAWLGFATDDLSASDWLGGITFTLESVVGPGHFSMWETGTFGSFNFLYSTNDPEGTANSNSLLLPIPTHAHYNLGFTAPGIYEVTITASGTHVTDGFLSDTQTLIFGVEAIPAVPEPATYGVAIGLLLLGVTIARRRQRMARTA